MIVVTGAKGQLGSDVCSILKKQGREYLGIDADELDITDRKAVDSFFEANQSIDSVIHCAAYTAVDKAESDSEKCFLVNEAGTENIARCCGNAIKLIYISTDYVFGSDSDDFLETDSEKKPLNVYGESNLAGEEAVKRLCKKHFIVRTSWVYGEKNTNFIATMLRLSKTHDEVKVVCDQIGSPTYSKHLASLLCDMIATEKFGIYHATNEGICSWNELAEEAFRIAGKSTKVIPVTTEEYNAPAKRPHNSRLSKKSLDESGFERLPDWHDAVKEYSGNIETE